MQGTNKKSQNIQKNIQKVGGGVTLENKNNVIYLKYNKSEIKSKIKSAFSKSAFSLIELSIVLIIIGLLVAGITGGASLIESAKNRAFINEVTGWKQAVLAFRAARGRYPGDVRNIGKFGYHSGYNYEKSDFAPPFNSEDSFLPIDISAPFVELYTEKISDFKPTIEEDSVIVCTGIPCSKVYKDIYFRYDYNTDTSSDPLNYLYNFRINTNILYIAGYNTFTKPKTFKSLDEKLDDGLYNAGNIRASCFIIVDGDPDDFGTTPYSDATYCLFTHYDLKLE